MAAAASEDESVALAPPAEDEEVRQLKDLFSGARPSPLSAGVYYRYRMTQENAKRAEEERQAKVVRESLRKEAMQRKQEVTKARRAEEVKLKTEKAAQRALTARNQQSGKVVRELYQEGQRQSAQQRAEFLEEVRLRAKEFKEIESTLEEEQWAKVEEKREAFARERAEQQDKLQKRLEIERLELSTHTARVKWEVQTGLKGAFTERTRIKRGKAEDKRQEAAVHKEFFAQMDEERMRKAAANRSATLARRNTVTKARADIIVRNQLMAKQADRTIDRRLKEARQRTIDEKKQKRLQIFASRYVPQEAANEFDGSVFRRLYSMDDVADQEIAKANRELAKKLSQVVARTDDDVMDEAAGMARADMAEESRERKAAEEAERAAENAAMRERIANAVSKTDDDISDEAAGFARAKMAEESVARRAAEAEELRQENQEYFKMISNTAAKTDDDITDDAAGAARLEAAADSQARKAAEQAAQDAENEEMRQRLLTTGARTDDDISDEAAGEARAVVAAESAARKAREAEELSSKVVNERKRIAAVTTKTDTDISDETAGMAREGYDLHWRGDGR